VTVAQHYPRDDLRYIEVSDADAAVVSLAWMRETARPIVKAFIQITRQVAGTDSAGQVKSRF
jgi:hypothetical protein